jgi:hypothetical protein
MTHRLSVHTCPCTHSHHRAHAGPAAARLGRAARKKVKVPYTALPLWLVLWTEYTKKLFDSFPSTDTGGKKPL